MSKTFGQAVVDSRRRQNIRASAVAEAVGLSAPSFSAIEKDQLVGGVSDKMAVKIASYLQDKSLLITYLQNNAAYQAVIPQIFPALNNIRKDPAIILTRWASEAREGVEAAMILSEIFSNADPTRTPNYRNTLLANLEQIVDSARCSEILFVELIEAGVISEEDRIEIHERQQRKCIEKGHHCEECAA